MDKIMINKTMAEFDEQFTIRTHEKDETGESNACELLNTDVSEIKAFLRKALEEICALWGKETMAYEEMLEKQEKSLRLSEEEVKLVLASLPMTHKLTVEERMKYQKLAAKAIIALQEDTNKRT